ncbi:MAG: asparagine synthase-related protein [Candidatus Omnitrophica bacterium]|nr:asparagine synthase-related protein [Candidatus Omnitrophota bacterium]
MAGIAGITLCNGKNLVNRMLDRITHRGRNRKVIEMNGFTIGIVFSEKDRCEILKNQIKLEDRNNQHHFTSVTGTDTGLILTRDMPGVKPMYYGFTDDGYLCFGSEIKALVELKPNIYCLPPGTMFDGNNLIANNNVKKEQIPLKDPDEIARTLREKLFNAVEEYSGTGNYAGVWLSGGLDSSIIAVVLKQFTKKLHTFSTGLKNSPDLLNASKVAEMIKSEHHEIIIDLDDILGILPETIYHLESFDALLVRSSIANYILAKHTKESVELVFSGECSDELFAGYSYMKQLSRDQLALEIISCLSNLHNTALQRVDRCSSAFGLIAQVPFAHPEIIDYALKIPVELKIHNGIEKWILRKAFETMLPADILNRTKAKFWEGSGIGKTILAYAEKNISDNEFSNEYRLKNGWELNSKEELFYYRIFREKFGELKNISWMGRTKRTEK